VYPRSVGLAFGMRLAKHSNRRARRQQKAGQGGRASTLPRTARSRCLLIRPAPSLVDSLRCACALPIYKYMSEHKVTLKWERGGAEFFYQKYPRDHTWSFDGGHTMTATAAPAYLGNPANVDPEEAFVASLSSCHMLTFLAIACKQKFVVDSYEDNAIGHMEKNADGKMAITRVELCPKIRWNSTKCTTSLTRIVSLPTQSKPKWQWRPLAVVHDSRSRRV
jgi:organic hydroperoxide reductase OsmC/OhrA